jgi:hypothetical protein
MKPKYSLPAILTLITIVFLLCSFNYPYSIKKETRSGLKSDTIDVLNYAIHLDMVFLSTKMIGGYTKLTITPKMNNVSAISLDLLKMTVDSISVNDSSVTSFTYNDTLLHFPLASPININDTIFVKVYYHGNPVTDPSGWGGFYFSSDSAYAYNLGVGFQDVPHNYGRVWFPCIDDFIDRATYDCNIRTKDSKMAVCGGTLINETNNGDGTKTYYWRLNSEIPTYLASVAVGSYFPVSYTFNGINGNIPVKIYVPSNDTSHAKSSFANLLSIFGSYENYFGPFLWERAGYVGIPFNGGAMEHATNIAYPIACFDGTLNYEYLYAHELSHHWFGDLVTCATAEDMWINEGWGDYCESFFRECLYGKSSYNANVKSNHYTVLSQCHIDDGGYYAIYGIPSNITYGSTVYKKGADVIHTMRSYLGDSLFFSMIKTWMSTYKFNHISTTEFRDFITTQTGIDMTDFFDGWIFSPGFPQYSIDSMIYEGTGNDYTVYVKQKLHQKSSLINSNIIEITFMNSEWQQYTESIDFSGLTGSKLFHLPFAPEIAMMDLGEKVSDATTDYSSVIKTTGNITFSNSFFILNILSVSDSTFFRVEHNWVAPDPFETPSTEIFRISGTRYWKIDGIFSSGFKASGRFNFNRTAGKFESTLLPSIASSDSLVLLYREDASDDWHVVNFTKTGNVNTGYLIANDLEKGEYTFGVGKPNQSGIEQTSIQNKSLLKVYPNPSGDTFNIYVNTCDNATIKIFDASNKLVYNTKVFKGQKTISWKPIKNTNTTYLICLYENGKSVAVEKAIYSH